MPRAKRYHLRGHVWHITHRCHKKEFLLKFARDRRRWLYWLFEAKKRYGLRVLDYIVTSNHIHLLVEDNGDRKAVPRSIQLVAGRTAQEYNFTKKRKGAFWEDRYHATAVESGRHLLQCIIYIDMNMARAGVVKHPKEWETSGYREIPNPKQRYSIIDKFRLYALAFPGSEEQFRKAHQDWIDEALKAEQSKRDKKWTESIAVGSKLFTDRVKNQLGFKARGRKSKNTGDGWELREDMVPYRFGFGAENEALSPENGNYFRNIIVIPNGYSGPAPKSILENKCATYDQARRSALWGYEKWKNAMIWKNRDPYYRKEESLPNGSQQSKNRFI